MPLANSLHLKVAIIHGGVSAGPQIKALATADIVVAFARNRAIGLNNKMPWHLPEDLKYFKRVTMGRGSERVIDEISDGETIYYLAKDCDNL